MKTLYTTVESGTNEDGTEYEKKQATAPRTFVEAITDTSGTPLSTKLSDILERIGQLDGGEYDTLLTQLQQLRQEMDALELDKWDYIVPEGENITFQGDNPATLRNNSASRRLVTDRGFEADFILTDLINFLNNYTIQQSTDGISIADKNNDTIATFKTGRIDFNNSLLTTQIALKSGGAFYFDNPSNSDQYRMFCNASNTFIIQKNVSGTWTTVIEIWPDGPCIAYDKHIYFKNSSGNHNIRIREDSFSNLVFERISGNTWASAAYMDSTSVWHFANNIVAPNIASTAALMEAQQEITEMDLQNIETQQALTEQELFILEREAV